MRIADALLSKGKGEQLLAARRQFETGIPVDIDQAPLDVDQSVCVPGPSSPEETETLKSFCSFPKVEFDARGFLLGSRLTIFKETIVHFAARRKDNAKLPCELVQKFGDELLDVRSYVGRSLRASVLDSEIISGSSRVLLQSLQDRKARCVSNNFEGNTGLAALLMP